MGREVRKVPPSWDHPKHDPAKYPYREGYKPMYDESFDDRFKEWLAEFDRIRSGDLSSFEKECYPRGLADWLQDEGTPPDPEYYMPNWADEDRTHFQMYETTSEGTPISPPMESPEKLARWLADNHASSFGSSTATYEQWLGICKGGFAPSAVMQDGKMMSGVEALGEQKQ